MGDAAPTSTSNVQSPALVKVSSFIFFFFSRVIFRKDLNFGGFCLFSEGSCPSGIIMRLQALLPRVGISDAQCPKASLSWLQALFPAACSAHISSYVKNHLCWLGQGFPSWLHCPVYCHWILESGGCFVCFSNFNCCMTFLFFANLLLCFSKQFQR